jgi:hypothetical protein
MKRFDTGSLFLLCSSGDKKHAIIPIAKSEKLTLGVEINDSADGQAKTLIVFSKYVAERFHGLKVLYFCIPVFWMITRKGATIHTRDEIKTEFRRMGFDPAIVDSTFCEAKARLHQVTWTEMRTRLENMGYPTVVT